MRILVNDFSGGAYEIELSRELASRGHSVRHVFFADNLSTPKGKTWAREDDPPSFAIEGLHVPMKFSKHSIRTRRMADIAYGKAVAAEVAALKEILVHIHGILGVPLDRSLNPAVKGQDIVTEMNCWI